MNGLDAHVIEDIAVRRTGHTLEQWDRLNDSKRTKSLEWAYRRGLIFPSEYFRIMNNTDLEGHEFTCIMVPTTIVQQYRRHETDYNEETGKPTTHIIMYALTSQLREVEQNVYTL